MEPRFTRGEYWLLETVVEHEWDIPGLMGSDLELHLNKKGHGLTRASLLANLYRLLSSGLIYAKNEVDGFLSTYQQIECALDETPWQIRGDKKYTVYGLTQEGGAQWEAFAAPDWGRYVDAGETFSDENENGIWEIICADKDWLDRYCEAMCFDHELEVSLETIAWDYIAPWQVTYWKQLDGAHRLRFEAQDKEEPSSLSQPGHHPEFLDKSWCAWR